MGEKNNVVFLDEEETMRRIHKACSDIQNNNKGSKVYGVSGIGNENPILVRTYDAATVELSVATKGKYKECVANDAAFQKFFDFPEYTDELGNVFITITPKSFRIDRTSNGEITAISVKEYEEGDEKLGFNVHPFFKNYVSETEYNGVVSRQVAKYMSSAYDVENEEVYEGYIDESNKENIVVRSVPNAEYRQSYANWDTGREIVKNTNPSYGIMSWMFVDLFRMLFLIYFARTDIHNLFGLHFEYEETDEGRVIGLARGELTGATDEISSHTGFNPETNQYKIFNIDDALAAISVDGCYQTEDSFYYAYQFDFDTYTSEGATKSTIHSKVSSYNGEYDIITKMGYDLNEPAFKVALAARPVTEEHPEDTIQGVYYSAKQKINPAEPGERGQMVAFAYALDELFPDNGAFFGVWYDDYYAWYRNFGLRLCKAPF